MIFTVTEQRRIYVSPFILSTIACIFDSSITFLTFTMIFSWGMNKRRCLPPGFTPMIPERERRTEMSPG
jgi:hypothetical protein